MPNYCPTSLKFSVSILHCLEISFEPFVELVVFYYKNTHLTLEKFMILYFLIREKTINTYFPFQNCFTPNKEPISIVGIMHDTNS